MNTTVKRGHLPAVSINVWGQLLYTTRIKVEPIPLNFAIRLVLQNSSIQMEYQVFLADGLTCIKLPCLAKVEGKRFCKGSMESNSFHKTSRAGLENRWHAWAELAKVHLSSINSSKTKVITSEMHRAWGRVIDNKIRRGLVNGVGRKDVSVQNQ